MTSYDDYIASIATLGEAIVDADHAAAKAQKAASTAVERFDQEHAKRVKGIQNRAVTLAQEYAATARVLQSRGAEGIGLKLPDKVRPTKSTSETAAAIQRQRSAASALESAVRAYEAAVDKAAGAASDAAEALAARRAALAKPTPEAAETSKRPLIGPLGDLPAMWGLLAVPLGSVGGIFGSARGAAIGVITALVIAFVLVGVFRINLGKFKRPTQTKSKRQQRSRSARAGVLDRATTKGTITGYEPEFLKDIEIPKHRLMYGEPGVGLADSGFGKDAVRAGQTGEINFAKALAKSDLIQRFATFWSIQMLSQDTYGREQADVDCAIVTGRTIWLVDLKYYAGGDVVYRSNDGQQLYCYDVPTGQQVGQPRKMSKNMQMAVERFQSRYKNYGYGLQGRVVFVPTDSGVGRIEGVKWPGDIPAVTLPDFLAELQTEPSFVDSLDGDLVRRTFQGLLKG